MIAFLALCVVGALAVASLGSLSLCFPVGPKAGRGLWAHGEQFLTDEDLAKYTVTAVNTGTAVVRDVLGGGLLISGAATTDDSGANVQFDAFGLGLGTGIGSIKWQAGVNLSDVAQSDYFGGICVSDTSIIASAPNDQIGFRKVDGSATLVAFVRRDGADISTSNVLTMVDGTEYALAFESFRDRTVFYIDGLQVASITHATNPATEEVMATAFAFQSGDANGTKTCLVGWACGQMVRT